MIITKVRQMFSIYDKSSKKNLNQCKRFRNWLYTTLSKHINPEEAVQVHKDLRAKQSIAIHWGTFVLTDEPLQEPPRRLGKALQDQGVALEEFLVLQHGQTLRF